MSVRRLTHDGQTLTVREWSNRTGIPVQAIYRRINIGWSVEQTLTTPARKRTKPTRGAILETEFYKLVCSIDGALRVFRKRIGSYVFEETDRGAIEMSLPKDCDRSIPAA